MWALMPSMDYCVMADEGSDWCPCLMTWMCAAFCLPLPPFCVILWCPLVWNGTAQLSLADAIFHFGFLSLQNSVTNNQLWLVNYSFGSVLLQRQHMTRSIFWRHGTWNIIFIIRLCISLVPWAMSQLLCSLRLLLLPTRHEILSIKVNRLSHFPGSSFPYEMLQS